MPDRLSLQDQWFLQLFPRFLYTYGLWQIEIVNSQLMRLDIHGSLVM